jgi:hypothetical protein
VNISRCMLADQQPLQALSLKDFAPEALAHVQAWPSSSKAVCQRNAQLQLGISADSSAAGITAVPANTDVTVECHAILVLGKVVHL